MVVKGLKGGRCSEVIYVMKVQHDRMITIIDDFYLVIFSKWEVEM